MLKDPGCENKCLKRGGAVEDMDWQRGLETHLRPLLNAAHREQVERVLAERTRAVTVVTEDLYQAHNGAAVLRACDNFGVQDVHAFSGRNAFRVAGDVVAGADRWVDVHHTRASEGGSVRSLATKLKRAGYRLVATTLRPGSVPLDQLPVTGKVALLFGTEEKGLSDEAHHHADDFVWLPMYGFTQSFNISVSLALSLFNLTRRLKQSDVDWQLSSTESRWLRLRWWCQMDEAVAKAASDWLVDAGIVRDDWPLV